MSATAPKPVAVRRAAQETVIVAARTVSCDGGESALGHPKVYLTMDETGRVECPYCDKLFVLDPNASRNGNH